MSGPEEDVRRGDALERAHDVLGDVSVGELVEAAGFIWAGLALIEPEEPEPVLCGNTEDPDLDGKADGSPCILRAGHVEMGVPDHQDAHGMVWRTQAPRPDDAASKLRAIRRVVRKWRLSDGTPGTNLLLADVEKALES